MAIMIAGAGSLTPSSVPMQEATASPSISVSNIVKKKKNKNKNQKQANNSKGKTKTVKETWSAYAPKSKSSTWAKGATSQRKDHPKLAENTKATAGVKTKEITVINDKSAYSGQLSLYRKGYEKIKNTELIKDLQTKNMRFVTGFKNLDRKNDIRTPIKINTIKKLKRPNSMEDNESFQKEIKGERHQLVQNAYHYPKEIGNKHHHGVLRYDYKFKANDTRYKGVENLNKRLRKFRAMVGLPTHGSKRMARSMKFYMYNRFKTPDLNLAHSRSFTHVFFTRPDLYLLGDNTNKPVAQVLNHSDAALLWRRRPEIFKLLTDKKRCNDTNNFNLLLSQQINSFSIEDDQLQTLRAGRSWDAHEMTYGDSYSGRGAGTFTCTFTETSEYSIISLLKLWMIYIDNISRGAWSPNYSKKYSHVYDRSLDYGASVYMFKCGPDGEDVLYWTKYYGVFPISAGDSALSWDIGTSPGDAPKLNVTFAYSGKKPLSPISLLEFNHLSNIKKKTIKWEPAFYPEIGMTGRPYVGAPYIEMDLVNPKLGRNDVNIKNAETQIRLKFRKGNKNKLKDKNLFN